LRTLVCSLALLFAAPGLAQEPKPYTLDDLTAAALAKHPRLAQAVLAVDAARGRAVQAGLYPNPTVSATFDELGDPQGPAGINTVPLVTQEIVTGRKLTLSRAAASKEIDLATLDVAARRAELLTAVRAAYFDALTLQRRIELLRDLVTLADASVAQTRKLLDAKQVARLDLVQLEIEAERLRTDLEAAEKERPAAFRRLAAVVGDPDLASAPLAGAIDAPFPDYELDRARGYVLSVHPEVRSAHVGVERAQLHLRRQQAEPIPNVSLSAGYVRQNQNRANDWTIGASVPVPLWNRNQGAIQTAQAELGSAIRQVALAETELTDRVAAAIRDFASARQRADRYRTAILPRAKESYDLSVKGYQGGQFEYLRVLEAQRSLTLAYLEWVKAAGEAWKAASVLSGLTLEEQWPPK
jgi:cobalt-zinc-cadmium efflux system outer membrane protein